MDERMLGAAVQGQDHAVGPGFLVDRPAGHLLVDVALVDDDRVAHPPGRGVDGADLVSAREGTRHVLGDVQDRAIRRQGVEVEDARQLHDPWLGSQGALDDGEPADRSRGGAVGEVLDQHDRRAVGRHAGRHRIEPDRGQPPRTLDRPNRPTEAGLDDEILDEAVRALRGDRDEVTPGRVRDAERQLDELLPGAGQGHAQVRFARSPDHQPGISRAGNDGRPSAADGRGGRGRRRDGRGRRRGRRRGCPTPERRPGARGHEHGDRHGQELSVRPAGSHRLPSSRCAGRMPTHPDYTDRGSTVPGYSSDSARAIVASRPRALSIRYVVSPSVQASASPTQRRPSSMWPRPSWM